MRPLLAIALATSAFQAQVPPVSAEAVLARYIEALGGERALRGVTTRTSEGRFDNGRGLSTTFRIFEEGPNHRAVVIGDAPLGADEGSGRAYDGAAGWDKNFVGTGLRSITGDELADLAREADLLRPLHLLDACASVSASADATGTVILCRASSGRESRLSFDGATGLLTEEDDVAGNRRIVARFDDYRRVDGVLVPFRTRFEVPGASITYTTSTVRQNAPIDPRVFRRPSR